MDRSALKGRLAHARRVARSIAHDPREGIEEAWDDACERWAQPAPFVQALRSPEWERRMHELLGAPWPCGRIAYFECVWEDIGRRLREGGLQAGRGAYGGWDDGDPGLARAAWCAVCHLRPLRTVETGVARGITSRMLLEALARNGDGLLWSIDRPPPPHLSSSHGGEVGFVVPPDVRGRWRLVSGSSRRRLRPLLADLGQIDLFIHDSLHSERNMRFELGTAWSAIRPGGVMLIDDVHRNAGFHRWAANVSDAHITICLPDDGQALFAIVVKRAG